MCSSHLGEWDGVVIELKMNGESQRRLLTYYWRNLGSTILTSAVCLLMWYTEKKMSLMLSVCTLTSCIKKGHNLNLITRTHPINPHVGAIYITSGMCSSKVSVSWKMKNGQRTLSDWRRPKRHATKCKLWSHIRTWVKEKFATRIYWGNWWNLNMITMLENSIASMLSFVIL